MKDNLFLWFDLINKTKTTSSLKQQVKNFSYSFFVSEWARSSTSKRKLILKILNLLIFNY